MKSKRNFQYASLLSLLLFLVMIQLACSSSSVGPTPIETSKQTNVFSELSQIDLAIKRSLLGNLAYNTPSSMQINETKIIQLIMSPTISSTALAGQISESGTIITASIKVTPRMKAELHSDDTDAFIIQVLHDNPEQLLSSVESTEWRWSVTAKKAGLHRLSLVVFRLVEYNGNEYWRQIAYESTIEVQVTLIQRIEQINWEWLVGVILTGLLIPAIWRLVDQRKKSKLKHNITNKTK